MVKSKLTQMQKKMIENQIKIIDTFEKSGIMDQIRSMSNIWTPEKIKALEDWKKKLISH